MSREEQLKAENINPYAVDDESPYSPYPVYQEPVNPPQNQPILENPQIPPQYYVYQQEQPAATQYYGQLYQNNYTQDGYPGNYQPQTEYDLRSHILETHHQQQQQPAQEDFSRGTIFCMCFLSYIFPIVGFILYCFYHSTNPRAASLFCRISTLSIIVNITIIMIYYIMFW